MRDVTDNEVGGFGITQANDLLFVTDFALVKQRVTCVSVSFEDESVADFFEDQVEAGRKPEQFARIWLHTHPGDSPEPSMTDGATFARVFGTCDWSVMCIVAQDSGTFAMLRFNVGPGGEVKIPVYVDYSYEFDAASFGCGACAAACKNGSAMLFVAAKVSQLALLPQGKVEGAARAKAMVAKMDELGFGNCTNTAACEAECPKAISISHIARLNREFLSAKFKD
jgi:ferredoxin